QRRWLKSSATRCQSVVQASRASRSRQTTRRRYFFTDFQLLFQGLRPGLVEVTVLLIDQVGEETIVSARQGRQGEGEVDAAAGGPVGAEEGGAGAAEAAGLVVVHRKRAVDAGRRSGPQVPRLERHVVGTDAQRDGLMGRDAGGHLEQLEPGEARAGAVVADQ